MEIVAASSGWISKQQLNLSLFLSDWCCRKSGLTVLLGHDGKVTSDKKMFVTHIKSIKLKIEIISAMFQWFLKQQANF